MTVSVLVFALLAGSMGTQAAAEPGQTTHPARAEPAVTESVPGSPATDFGPWSLGYYFAAVSGDSTEDVFEMTAEFHDDDYLSVFAAARKMYSHRNIFDLELEGQLGIHHGQQNHLETNGAFVFRWFPHEAHRTSLAAGVGLSWASEISKLEAKHHEDQEQLLLYVLVEVAFTPSRHRPRWGMFARLHHRSGLCGMLGGVREGSNAVGMGVRYRF